MGGSWQGKKVKYKKKSGRLELERRFKAECFCERMNFVGWIGEEPYWRIEATR